MEKRQLEGLDATLYQETLANGFTIYMIPFPEKKNYSLTYATFYGSEIIEFMMPGNKKKRVVPPGIAHFLEHKMFEQENGEDPFLFFGKTGTDANAATDYTYTKYICSGTKNFKENFRYLLQYVNSPYFTDENVEKEKGIIAEELNMYLDIPEMVLEDKIRENIYRYHPHRIDVGGTVEDIKKITKEDLYDCYHTFYQPNNMFALVVGNFLIEDALQVVHEEMDNRKNQSAKPPAILSYHEDERVMKEKEVVFMNIKNPKVYYAIKLSKKSFPIKDKKILNLYLNLLVSILLGSSSLFRQKARQEGIMNDMYYSFEEVEDIITLIIEAETKKPEEFLMEIKKTLGKITLTEEEIERYKKVWISSEVRMIDYVDLTTNNVFSDIINYKEPVVNRIMLIRQLNKKELEKILPYFSLKNTSELIALPKEESPK